MGRPRRFAPGVSLLLEGRDVFQRPEHGVPAVRLDGPCGVGSMTRHETEKERKVNACLSQGVMAVIRAVVVVDMRLGDIASQFREPFLHAQFREEVPVPHIESVP